jgi:ATP-dependent DNA helicase RecQ
MTTYTREELEKRLKKTFNFPKFHDDQWLTIERIMKGEKVLLIEKTGFGKSLCFQFPATIFKGTTIVFSPLIALMRDQVKKLNSLGISAKCINSEQTPEENSEIIEAAKKGKIKILYIAPERQENNEWIEATQELDLSMIVIDEAHCISVWGHDFRPAFRRITNLVKLLPKGLPVLATTATATKTVENDIAEQIGDGISILRGNLLRENFNLYVIKVESDDEKLIWLGQNLSSLPGSGILYTGTRVDTEIYSKWFEYLNLSAMAYNAGLDTDSRIDIETGLMENRWKCVISTNALGMGIDKGDIRFIIHTQIPQSPIHYYQEIGRAGRDGQPANIILFYGPNDTKLPESFIESARPSIAKYKKVIEVVKEDLLGEREIARATNLKVGQIRVIKSDLIDQGIIRELMVGKSKKYEYVSRAPELNTETFDALKKKKKSELDEMIKYVDTTQSRMKFLCDFLGDTNKVAFTNCDNTGLQKLKLNTSQEWIQKLQDFREDYFPTLEVESAKSNIVNGVAASYYGVSNVGAALHRCKYETREDFPDFLVKLTLKAFKKKFGKEKFDYVAYVPPTSSGGLVKVFAAKIAQTLNIPITHDLVKTRATDEQKVFENGFQKSDNVSGAFTFNDPKLIRGKNILLIDDIFDSGATIKEIGKLFTTFGVSKIAPLVIARTVGGDVV